MSQSSGITPGSFEISRLLGVVGSGELADRTPHHERLPHGTGQGCEASGQASELAGVPTDPEAVLSLEARFVDCRARGGYGGGNAVADRMEEAKLAVNGAKLWHGVCVKA